MTLTSRDLDILGLTPAVPGGGSVQLIFDKDNWDDPEPVTLRPNNRPVAGPTLYTAIDVQVDSTAALYDQVRCSTGAQGA